MSKIQETSTQTIDPEWIKGFFFGLACGILGAFIGTLIFLSGR